MLSLFYRLLTADWKAAAILMGINNANAQYFCLWCYCSKRQIRDFDGNLISLIFVVNDIVLYHRTWNLSQYVKRPTIQKKNAIHAKKMNTITKHTDCEIWKALCPEWFWGRIQPECVAQRLYSASKPRKINMIQAKVRDKYDNLFSSSSLSY